MDVLNYPKFVGSCFVVRKRLLTTRDTTDTKPLMI